MSFLLHFMIEQHYTSFLIFQRSEKTQQETRKSVRTAKTATKTAKTSKSRRKTARFSDSDDDSVDSRRRGVSRQSLPKGPVINTERTYQGKYYDPGTTRINISTHKGVMSGPIFFFIHS